MGAQNSPCTIAAEQKQDNRNGEQHPGSGTLTGPNKDLAFERNCLLLNNDLVNTKHTLR